MTATGCGQGPGDYGDDALTSLLSHLNVSVSSSIWTQAESNFLNILNFRGIRKYGSSLGYCLTPTRAALTPNRHPQGTRPSALGEGACCSAALSHFSPLRREKGRG
jgi:hypothetical protein